MCIKYFILKLEIFFDKKTGAIVIKYNVELDFFIVSIFREINIFICENIV